MKTVYASKWINWKLIVWYNKGVQMVIVYSITAHNFTSHDSITTHSHFSFQFSHHVMYLVWSILCFGKWQCGQRFFKEKVFHNSRLGRERAGPKNVNWLHRCAGMCIRRTLATVDLSPIPFYYMNESDPISWHRLLKSKTIKIHCVQIQKPIEWVRKLGVFATFALII